MIYGFTVYITGHSSNNFPPNPTDRNPPWTWFLQEESKDVDDALGVLGMNGLRESGRNRPGYIWFMGALSWVSKPETFVTQASWPSFQPCCPYLIWIRLILLTHPHVFRKESIEHVGKNFCFGVYRCQVWLLHNRDLGWTWKWCSWHRITFLTTANHLPL